MTRDYAAPDWRGLCQRMADELDHYRQLLTDDRREVHPLAVEARTALAQPEPEVAIGDEWRPCVKLPITVHVREQRPGETHVSTREGITPIRPDDLIMRGVMGEEYPIGRELFERTYRLSAAPAPAEVAELVAWLRGANWDRKRQSLATRAADLLERQAAPVPVAVSERLPGTEDCDAEGRCWWSKPYGYRGRNIAEPYYLFGDSDCYRFMACTHWLPAHALPLPSGEVE